MVKIHAMSDVSKDAIIGEGTEIGPFCVIGPKVKIGKNNKIHSNVVITGRTTIGDNNEIFQFASIGEDPQDLKFNGEDSELIIGNNNKIREYVTIHKGTETGIMKTQVGNNNLLMGCCHLAHDVVMGDNNILANNSMLAGHVIVGSHVIISGLSGTHQFTRLGDGCFISGGSMISRDIAPFCYAQGDRAGLVGINQIGLIRAGVSKENVMKIRKLYRKVFLGDGHFKDRIAELKADPEYDFDLGKIFLDFLSEDSIRGFTLARKNANPMDE